MTTAEWMWISGAVLAVAVWMVRERIKFEDGRFASVGEKIDELEAEQVEIKMNYLDRFKELNANVTKGHIEIKDAIADLKLDLAKGYVAKLDCPLLHKSNDPDQT